MSLTPREIPTGAVRYNTDSNKMEVYIGDTWMEVSVSSPNLDGGTRGLYVAGSAVPSNPATNFIDMITIPTAGNAVDFGDDTVGRRGNRGGASRTRGVTGGGAGPSPRINVISFVTFSSQSDAQDFGDLSNIRTTDGVSNQTRCLFMGGEGDPGNKDTIDAVTIATTGSSFDFGNLTGTDAGAATFSSPTRGFFLGGTGDTDNMQFVTIASQGDAQDFDTLDSGATSTYSAGFSNSTRGFKFGGYSPYTNSIHFMTMSTLGNMTNFGDMTVDGGITSGCASSTRGIMWGRYKSPGTQDGLIDYITISTMGNAVDFGDMANARYNGGAISNGHGGL